MNYENLPLYSTSVKIIKYWALIGDYHWRRYAAIIPSVLLNICQFADIFLTKEPIDAIIRGASFLVLWFNTLLRTTLLVYNRRRYEVFLRDIAVAYAQIERSEDNEIQEMLAQTAKSARGLANVNFGIGTLASAGFVMYPLFTSVRALPYGAHVPEIDKYASPWYELLYTYQFIVSIPGCCMYIPFTNLVVVFIMFSILMDKVLMSHLSKLKDRKREQVWTEVVWCIRFQMQIIRYVDIINSLTTFIYLAEFLTCGALLCALLFLLNMLGTVCHCCWIIIMILAQISAMYWFANELYHQSVEVALEVYSTNWFDFD